MRSISQEITFKAIKLRPTLARNNIFLDLPSSLPSGTYQGQIINLLGQSLEAFSFSAAGQDEVVIPIDHLERGTYFIRFQVDNSYYQGKFIKP